MPLGPHVDDTRPLRILVPLDGSVHAKAALVPAAYLVAALATPEQGAIHLVRVAKLSVMADTEERERLLYRAKRYLEATVEQIREGYVAPSIAHLRLPVTWSVAFDTDVAGAIVRVAENGEDAAGTGIFGGCDVIAMATHGSGGLERWATGSIAARVLRLTNLPLLLVRPSSTIEVKE
ncbi:MAG TPA: hypothetical protein DHW02_18085 [Ktedonobacter sp.]|nr:hypothetical protein [Ktedonobacter sp.]